MAADTFFYRRVTRTKKPGLSVGIDWSNPLTKGLRQLYLFNGNLRDTVRGYEGTLGSATTFAPYKEGKSLYHATGTQTDANLSLIEQIKESHDELTYTILINLTSRVSWDAVFSSHNTTSDRILFFNFSDTDIQFYIHGGAWNIKTIFNFTVIDLIGTGPHVVQFAWSKDRNSGAAEVTIDGYLHYTSSETQTTSCDRTHSTGSSELKVLDGPSGYVGALAFHDRYLTRAERVSLTNNFYQLFDPIQQPVFIASAGGDTSAVQSDTTLQWSLISQILNNSTLQWNIVNAIQNDSTLQWSLVNAIQNDSTLQWSIIESILNDSDLRWSLIQALQNDSTLQWDILNALQNDSTLQWDIVNAIQNDSDLRWSIIEAILNDSDMRWNILSALTSVQNDSTLQWSLIQAITSDSDLRWSVIESILNDSTLQWNIDLATSPVQNDSTLQWSIIAEVFQTLTAQWNLFEAVISDNDLRWNVLNTIANNFTGQWNILSAIANGATLQWDMVEAINGDVMLQWHLGDVQITPTPTGRIFVIKAENRVIVIDDENRTYTVH